VEPISPELVLIDPELARVARAQLAKRAEIDAIRQVVEAATVASPPSQRPRVTLPKRFRQQLTFAALSLSVAVNGALLAVVIGGDAAPTAVAAQRAAAAKRPIVAHEVEATAVQRIATSPRVRVTGRLPNKAAVERRILALAFRSPKTTLPPQLIDAHTGLPKNNLQAICRHERARIFRCVVRAVNQRSSVVVRYRVLLTGRGIYSWSRPDAR
jgi:hypothetical protein